jgi:HK97 gp10 family phage protein
MSISLKGLESVLGKIDSLSDTAKVQESLGQACALVERSAKQKAPKDNGDLRRSISSVVKDTEGIVFTPLEYAPYVEFGTGLFAEGGNGRKNVPWRYKDDKGNWHKTSGQKPQPFMRPALKENRNKIIRIVKEGMKND